MEERRKNLRLSSDDVREIVEAVYERIQERPNADFHIPPEKHYLAHRDIGEMYADWKAIKDIFMKILVGFLFVGMLVFAVAGALTEGVKHLGNWFKGS